MNKTIALFLQLLDSDLGLGDTLYIYDSNQATNERLLATYTGDNTEPQVLLSSGQHIFIFLDTSSRETGRGFQLLYATGCDVRLENAAGGIIVSPGYDRGEYLNFLSCTWTISSLDGKPLRLKVHSFDLETDMDFLEVREMLKSSGKCAERDTQMVALIQYNF